MLVVDISENNEYVDFDALQAAGVEHVIVRAGYGQGNEDSRFRDYSTETINRGMKLSAYWFSYALSVDQAAREGGFCRDIINSTGLPFEAVYFDMEDSSWRQNNSFSYDKQECTAMCDAFINESGLYCGVYANLDWFSNYLDYDYLSAKYPIWLAQYDSQPSLACYIWQYSENETYAGYKIDSNRM